MPKKRCGRDARGPRDQPSDALFGVDDYSAAVLYRGAGGWWRRQECHARKARPAGISHSGMPHGMAN